MHAVDVPIPVPPGGGGVDFDVYQIEAPKIRAAKMRAIHIPPTMTFQADSFMLSPAWNCVHTRFRERTTYK